MKIYLVSGAIVFTTLFSGCSDGTSAQSAVAKTPSHLQGPEALVYATRGGDLETVKLFVEQSPELLQAQNHDGNTLLHIAAGYNRLEIVSYLIEKGASPEIRNYKGLTCYEHADSENADREVLALLRP